MYEASFGLKRRPFAATPDATCFLSSDPIQAALDEIVVCVEHGQGIAVLTAPAGTGKTLLCERLRCELDTRYETVFLRHASFLTRRALLQTLLCELNHTYHHPSEQELRLELFPTIRALQPKREALVLICDEAHQLTESLLEELRILADFAESGRPLVRLVLVGQLSLEEKLAQPNLEAFNQRIRAHVSLSPFDHAGSLDYIDYRLTWAGGRTEEVFTPEALELIAKASDGVPRCINQLADHSLLLAFVAEQRPVGPELVQEALGDLRQLPLHWNEPSQSLSTHGHSERLADESHGRHISIESSREPRGYLLESGPNESTYSYETDIDSENHKHLTNTFVLGTGNNRPIIQSTEFSGNIPSTDLNRVEIDSDDWRKTIDLFDPQKLETSQLAKSREPELEPDRFNSDDQITSKTASLLHFHDLLQDAYAAAGTSPINSSDDWEHEKFDQQPTNSLSPWGSQSIDIDSISSTHNDPSHLSMSGLIAPISANAFYEEIIIDRYASIDAGFAPPTISQQDTIPEPQVHEHSDNADELTHVSSNNDFNFNSTDHDVVALPAEALSSSDSSLQERHDADSQLTESHSEPENGDLERTQTNPPLWDRAITNEASTPSLDETWHDDRWLNDGGVNQVADEVYALAESLRPTGTLSATSESILKLLRNEVDITPGKAPAQEIAPVATESSWESIETPAVEQPADPRPCRYLFSKLRRKQHGLA